MSTEQFIASLVSSLAWPVAVVAIAVIFRVQLRQLLGGRLSRLKAGPIEAEFDLVASHVQLELPAADDRPLAASPLSRELRELAESSPRGAILEAHDRVERTLRDALEAVGDPVREGDTATELARRAAARGLITPQTSKAVEGITVLRNLAVHDPDGLPADRVKDYLVLADSVLYAIRENLRRSPALGGEQATPGS